MKTKTKTAQHTPGPWKIGAGDEVDGYGILGNESEPDRLGRTILTHIAIVHGQPNAQLISVAPELLSHCERLLWLLDNHNGAITQTPEAIQGLRATVAKSKGQP